MLRRRRGEKEMEHLLSTPSWTRSARLEPGRLVGSPSYGGAHHGNVTPNSPGVCVSLARPQCCCSLLYASLRGSDRPKHTPTDCIGEKNGVYASTHTGCTSWKPRNPHETSTRPD
ncbi:unnamed protein product [Pleuronectes platessa]|uniref:Uncharacterized protein n=1 Tax=Pleuronectes platessa TaxID=8262 RepID=A0A9N7Z5E2_PLEPL|nr:unnamed protein product [Pleuronectes platessa]